LNDIGQNYTTAFLKYTPTKFIDEELDYLMQKKGFIKSEDKISLD
jgi:3-methyladenine DNA glycosylase Tag